MQMALTVWVTFSTLPSFEFGLAAGSVLAETCAEAIAVYDVGWVGEILEGEQFQNEMPCAHL